MRFATQLKHGASSIAQPALPQASDAVYRRFGVPLPALRRLAANTPVDADAILVTLHVYAPPLAKTRKYQLV